jgi:hypothetical protein
MALGAGRAAAVTALGMIAVALPAGAAGAEPTDAEQTLGPDSARPANSRPGTLIDSVQRPSGTAEFGFGWLTLPGAQVCVERDEAGCRRGDSSLALEAWQVFRVSAQFALGAGITLGLTPTTDAPRSDPEGIERDHTRRYFMAEVGARYYPYVGETLEAWLGVTTGLAVVSDTFATRPDPPNEAALVGPRGVTIRTEGLAIGAGGGVAYQLYPSWLIGGNLRYGSWFLPKEPETDPLGDEASLVGRNSVIIVGVNVAFRIEL